MMRQMTALGLVLSFSLVWTSSATLSQESVLTTLDLEKGKGLAEWIGAVGLGLPTDEDGLLRNGLESLRAEDYQRARHSFAKGVKRYPLSPQVFFFLGYCQTRLGRFAEALDAYRQAIRLQPNFPQAYNGMGLVFSKLDQWPEAAQAYQEAVRLKPDFAAAYGNLGVAYGLLGQYQEELNACLKAIHVTPSSRAYNNLGVAYSALGRYRKLLRPTDRRFKAIQSSLRSTTIWGLFTEIWDSRRRR